jgi:chromosome segregation ATPase
MSLVTAVTVVALAAPGVVNAKTDVRAKVEQLKENAENSRVNLKQYEENLKIVNSNLDVTEKAVRDLERQKEALARQTAESKKDKATVGGAKKQLETLLIGEQQKLAIEQKQIEELKKALAQAETNALKRQQNVDHYQEKLKNVDGEMASWSERNQSIIELEQALQSKNSHAKAERKKLSEKKVNYEDEVSKWRKQVRVSEREMANFSKIKD